MHNVLLCAAAGGVFCEKIRRRFKIELIFRIIKPQ